jgi:hypothetical protein
MRERLRFVTVSSLVVLIESTEFLNVCCFRVQAMSLKAHVFVAHLLKPSCVAASAVIEIETVICISQNPSMFVTLLRPT